MGMKKLINLMLIERGMKKKDLAAILKTSPTNISSKLRRDNFSERELRDIAAACDATFNVSFVLNDTGKEIK